MELAIKKAKEGIKKGQTPFASCIVRGKKVIACSHNLVWMNKDPTAHAEINAIRQACKKLKSIDLTGCTIYSTCEPCPMCFGAIHWSKISRIFYGARIRDSKIIGFDEMEVSNRELNKESGLKEKIIPDFMRKECLELFKEWKKKNRKAY